MVYKTLNNCLSRTFIECAARGDYRVCSYSLFNQYMRYTSHAYYRLFKRVKLILISKGLYDKIFVDNTINHSVKFFIKSMDSKIEEYEKTKNQTN